MKRYNVTFIDKTGNIVDMTAPYTNNKKEAIRLLKKVYNMKELLTIVENKTRMFSF